MHRNQAGIMFIFAESDRVIKKKKYVLSYEQKFAFDMVGICSHHTDYRLVWGINNKLHLQLEKMDDAFIVTNKKGMILYDHSYYQYVDPDNRIEYYLMKNKVNGKCLIPEKPTIDFFLFFCENHYMNVQELMPALKEIPSILAVYEFDPRNIPSAEFIVFN